MAAVSGQGPAGFTSSPKTRVELHISCAKLKNTDVLSKSDPIVVVYAKQAQNQWTEFARTEWIKNTLNPEFSRAVEMDYRFEEVQTLQFSVYDVDNLTPDLSDDDFLGCIQCSLGEVVSRGTYTKPLSASPGKEGDGKLGTITIRATEIGTEQSMLELWLSGSHLDKKDFLGKSDPFLEFFKQNSDGSFTLVHKTEVVMNTLNPTWKPFQINSQRLCGHDPECTIKVVCYDYDSDGTHDLIGQFTTNFGELTQAHQKHSKLQWDAINPQKQAKKRSYKNSGVIHLNQIKISRVFSFLDYMMGGCGINFTVGVDFTASNGDPKLPSSLHYIDPHKPNEYTLALMAVGQVCQDYDSDKLFPALGFGAKIGETVSHEFALNGNPQNPYCAGIQGVVQAYHQALQSVQLWGPTNVAPIINHVARFAEQAARDPKSQQYFVLLLLTDGVLSDMYETKLAVIRASRLPMSIIIVGVGAADFRAMNELDADDGKLRAGSEVAERDIVQFVPFRQFANASPETMASVVLAEVPQQLVEYMQNRGITPMNVQ